MYDSNVFVEKKRYVHIEILKMTLIPSLPLKNTRIYEYVIKSAGHEMLPAL